jgi:hypothetical protein
MSMLPQAKSFRKHLAEMRCVSFAGRVMPRRVIAGSAFPGPNAPGPGCDEANPFQSRGAEIAAQKPLATTGFPRCETYPQT